MEDFSTGSIDTRVTQIFLFGSRLESTNFDSKVEVKQTKNKSEMYDFLKEEAVLLIRNYFFFDLDPSCKIVKDSDSEPTS